MALTAGTSERRTRLGTTAPKAESSKVPSPTASGAQTKFGHSDYLAMPMIGIAS